jgi:mitochondrial translocator assembly and maintenance protein 41
MHKPIRIIKDDARVRLTQQVNLTSAVRAALLTLPEEFPETLLFERIAGISYTGDPRMVLPAENRGKVANIVKKQAPQFKELYHRLVVALPGVHWPSYSGTIQQDISPKARSAHLKMLPSNLLQNVRRHYASNPSLGSLESDPSMYWVRLAGETDLPQALNEGLLILHFAAMELNIDPSLEVGKIIRYPAFIQSVKGIVSSGVVKGFRYSAAKVGKWWNSRGSSTTKQS